MNPETNRFEPIAESNETDPVLQATITDQTAQKLRKLDKVLRGNLFRPNGTVVPEGWATFQIGETIEIKNYTFKVQYIGESAILFEPVGPVVQ